VIQSQSQPGKPVISPDTSRHEYDEMVSGSGAIRPAWHPLVGAMHGMAKGAFAERVERVERQHEDIAVAYSIQNEPQAMASRRPFDLLPMLLEHEAWSRIEAGLSQRARLYDRLIGDIYGPRRLVAEGILPPALVYGNPRFLRPCSFAPPTGAPHVSIYAADLIRGPDGSWRVLADRLQAPAGIGVALQNRIILARTVPELFRAHQVQRIEPFFDLWRDALTAAAPSRNGAPRVVVLTPGPFNAAYFEHVYLARQLGATLVEGADLTMRDQRVYVKTLGHLQPVDVILRFVEDDYCDPLELRGTSVLGVAGLLQAVRAGTVVVVNALGTGVAETPALRPFLPQLAQTLLGEILTLPSVETAWLGAPGALDTIDNRLSDDGSGGAVIKPAFATRRDEQAFVEEFERRGRRALLEEVRRQPALFIAETPPHPSVIPVWTPDGLVPRPMTLRIFLVQHEGRYHAMPGGLTLVPHQSAGAVTTLHQPPMSKDTWVLTGEDQPPAIVVRSPPPPLSIQRPGDELRSRTADDLFWLGRYSERLDNAARIMRSAAVRLAVDHVGPGHQHEWQYLVRLLIDARLIEPSAAELLPDGAGLLLAVSAIGPRANALPEVFRAVHRIAQTLRDRLSNDMWKVVIGLLRDARERLEVQPQELDRFIAALDNVIGVVAAFGGMTAENMTRGNGWRFLDVGRRLERAHYGASALFEMLADDRHDKEGPLALALELFDSSITYRSRYLSAVQSGPVFDLVLADETNPRGVAFQLNMIVEHLQALATAFGRPSNRPELALAEQIQSSLRQAATDRLSGAGDRRAVERLAELLGTTRQQLLSLSEVITRTYFSHVRVPRAVGYEWSTR
jgi:uncharacterized circularly permuted ATP-grasp superfamily protein/uncharacterized alpha-E superfamily protein